MSIGNRELVERYLGCYNAKEVEAMLDLFAEDAVFESVSNTTGVIRGGVVGQVEFPIIKIKSWPMFNTYSTYGEYQLWFISSDVSAGIVQRLAAGIRVGLF